MNQYRYFLRLAYDGSCFHGWQRQPNAVTIQQTLEESMSVLLRCPITLTGAGRTDTGVHAEEYFAHFDLQQNLLPSERDKIVFKLNRFLASDIAISDLIPVTGQAHARFSAVSRSYRYCIAREKNPFRHNFTYFIYGKIDHELMNRGAELIMSYRDFTSFSKVDTDTKTNNCQIVYARWQYEESELVFTITADRFLRNMVRAIVGTLIALGTGKMSMEELKQVIEGKNRSDAGDSVPAKGLALHRIIYPPEIFIIKN